MHVISEDVPVSWQGAAVNVHTAYKNCFWRGYTQMHSRTGNAAWKRACHPLNWRSSDTTIKLTAVPLVRAFFFFHQLDSDLKMFFHIRNRFFIYRSVWERFCSNCVCVIIDQFTSGMVYRYWNRKETSDENQESCHFPILVFLFY